MIIGHLVFVLVVLVVLCITEGGSNMWMIIGYLVFVLAVLVVLFTTEGEW